MSVRKFSFLTGVLVLGAVLATSPALALTVTGDPDNSFIIHRLGGSATVPGGDDYRNYSDASVVHSEQTVGQVGGTLHWAVDASIDQGIMKAFGSASSMEACWAAGCIIHGNTVFIELFMQDRVYIDQSITAPTTVAVRLSGNGMTSAPAGGSVETRARANIFVNPFGTVGHDEFVSPEIGGIDFALEAFLTLNPGQQWFDVQTAIGLRLTSSPTTLGVLTMVDLGHTALFDIVLPEGLSFHTEGGFTGRSATAVPEPATLGVVATGLLLLVVFLRQWRPQGRCTSLDLTT